MIDSYKGESWPKKVARLQFWFHAAIRSGKRFTNSRVLVLAGRTGGDIDVLTSLGIKADQIVAVDKCDSALASSHEKHPEVEHILGSASEVVSSRPNGFFDIVFLDLCSCLSSSVISDIDAVASRMRDNSVLGVNLLRGRESGSIREKYQTSHFRSLCEEFQRLGGYPGDAKNVDYWDRDTFIALEILKRGKRALHPAVEIHYQSVTEDSRGVPMMTSLFIVEAWNPYLRNGKRKRLERAIRETLEREALHPLLRDQYIEVSSDIRTCKQDIANLLKSCPGSEEAVGLTRAQAAALKAHCTMGTYES